MVSQTVVLGKGYLRLKPEFGFPVRTLDVNVHTGLFQGEEESPERPFSKESSLG
jgi:hypothetical protein